jgi:hypothetical protein
VVHLHSVGFFGERLDNHFLVIVSLFFHHCLRVGIYDRSDIVGDIFLLTAFVVQGYPEMCQWCESGSEIKLRSAGDAHMKVRKVQVNELLDKRKDLFTRR